jgi:hypothetical protein
MIKYNLNLKKKKDKLLPEALACVIIYPFQHLSFHVSKTIIIVFSTWNCYVN